MPAQKGAKTQDLVTGRLIYVSDGINTWAIRAATTEASSGEATPFFRTYPEKTIQTELYAAASLAASSQAASTILSLAGIIKATVFIDHGRGAAAAFGTQGTEYRIEASQKASGNETWRPLASVVAGSAAALAVASSGAVGAGTTVITITSGTALTLGDIVMWANTASAASIEWARVVAISGTANFTVQYGMTNAQAAAHTIYTRAEHFAVILDTGAVTRMRVIINNNASGTTQAIYSRIACITES